MSYFNFFTHPEFTRFTSGELCPSMNSERGEATSENVFGFSGRLTPQPQKGSLGSGFLTNTGF